MTALAGVALAFVVAGPQLLGQSALTDLTANPIAGAGRAYLTSLHEAVDPATGQLALRIPVALPSSRGFGLHFAIAYDSGARVSYEPNDSRTFSNSYLDRDGWSYTVPRISFLEQDVPYYGYDSYGDYVQLGTCHDITNYVYNDDQGGRLDLGLERAYDPAGTPPPNDACTNLNIGDFSSGGWNGGTAWFDPTRLNTDNVIDLSTDDGMGMTMLNPEHYRAGGTNVSPTTVALIDQLTDRNGNLYRIADNGSGKIVYTDSDQRVALSTSGFADSSDTISVIGGYTYTVTWQSGSAQAVTVPTSLNYTPTGHTCPADAGLLTPSTSNGIVRIQLPNGTAFTLSYDPVYGQVSRLTYPSGAYVRYVWGFGAYSEYTALGFSDGSSCTYMATPLVITDRYVSPDGVHETLHQMFTYTASAVAPRSYAPATRTTTVRDYDGSGALLAAQVYTYDDTNAVRPQATTIETENAQGQVLRTVQQSWPTGAVELPPTSVVTTLDNGKVAKTVRSYSGNQLTEQDDYDYGPGAPGPLLRKVVHSYLNYSNIVDRPTLTEVFDGASSTPASATVFCYDQTSVTAVSGLTAHDETNFGTSSTQRGNLTQKLEWVNPPSGNNALPTCGQATGSNALSSTFTYDEAGQLLSATDPGGHTTRSTWGDAANSSVIGTDAFLAQVQYPDTSSPNLAHHIESYSWDYATGHMLSHTDQNGQTTSYEYADPLGRLTRITSPAVPLNGGAAVSPVTTVAYGDTPGNLSTEVQKTIDTATSTDEYTLYDGLGRAVSHSLADPDNGWDRTDTSYDGEGRVAFQSYPCAATSPTGAAVCTAGDSFAYDALGRTLTVTHSDQSQITYSYLGAATEVQDEGNGSTRVTHVYQHDGLGRLVSVCEGTGENGAGTSSNPTACSGQIPGFTEDLNLNGFETGYGYDALGDLTEVQQPGLNPRTFTYDSLARLTAANNPESGTVVYSWDAAPAGSSCAGQATPAAVGELVQRVDARGVATCLQYDALERLTRRSYSDGTYPELFGYDEASFRGNALSNTVGRLSSEQTLDQATPETQAAYGYDALGRRQTAFACAAFACGYAALSGFGRQFDLLGDATARSETGYTLSQSFNRAGRLTTAVSNWSDASHPPNLFTQAHYNAFGGLTAARLADAAETRGYDGRGRLLSIQDGSLYAASLTYAPDGDVLSSHDSVNGDWSYQYDALNRLARATCVAAGGCAGLAQNQGLAFSYDRYGNRWQVNDLQGGQAGASLGFDASNRIVGDSYDAAGHLLHAADYPSAGACLYGYDGAGRLASVGNCNSASYLYDAAGRRALRWTPATDVRGYLYGLDGESLTELAQAAPQGWARDEVWAAGRHLATYRDGNSGTGYLPHADGLGTERLRADADGAPCARFTSRPFGGNEAGSGSCTGATPAFFTGQPRDPETGLDDFGARMYSSSLGRFMTPDWSAQLEPVPYAKLDNPQSLNLYSYVLNNPVTRVDPDGHYNTGCKGSDISKCSKDIQNFEANRQRNLHSKDAGVRAAAAAYGNFNDGNRVDLKFDGHATAGRTQQESNNGKATDRIQVTLPGMGGGVTAANAGVVAHEGSHVEDIQSAIQGGISPTRYQGEMKAYETQAAVLNDFYLFTSARSLAIRDGGASMSLMNPFDRFSEEANREQIERFLILDSNYGLSEISQGGPVAVQP